MKAPEENANSDGDSNSNKKWKPYETPITEKNFFRAYKSLANKMISAGDGKFMPAIP